MSELAIKSAVDDVGMKNNASDSRQKKLLSKPTTKTSITVPSTDVHLTLSRHMLVDGFDLVVDLKKSQGCY